MINSISKNNYNPVFKKTYTGNIKPQEKNAKFKPYKDSFIRNAKEASPMLLAFTSIFTILEHGKTQIEIPKLLKKNILTYFAPVLIGTSALCAIIENKKSKKV